LESFAALRIESAPPSPFLKWVRRAPAEDGFEGFQAPAKCALAIRQAGAERRCEMAKYKSDPRWISVKFDGSCARCKSVIRRGERAFYYPQNRSLYCERDNCGQAASRDFSARVFDEERSGSI
jgi:hypothetical protein